MKAVNLEVSKRAKPVGSKRKDGTRRKCWILSGIIPGEQYHRSYHKTRNSAENKKKEIETIWWEKAKSPGISKGDFERANLALLELENTSNLDAKKRDILFAVRWFVLQYRDTSGVGRVTEYIDQYYDLRKNRREHTQREGRYFLEHFRKGFGNFKPTDISSQELDAYLASMSCRFHRDKVLRTFFNWLSNSAQRMRKLSNPPLKENPFIYIERVRNQEEGLPEICTNDEVRALIQEAIYQNCVTWFVWGFFTGMRPGGEMVKFWNTKKFPQFGWNRIFLDCDNPTIQVPKTIEKMGTRNREIVIKPNLLDWLNFFKANPKKFPFPPTNRVKLFRAVKYAILPPGKQKEHDIMRHTFISNLYKTDGADECIAQCATSLDMIQKNYLCQILKKEAEAYWKITPNQFDWS